MSLQRIFLKVSLKQLKIVKFFKSLTINTLIFFFLGNIEPWKAILRHQDSHGSDSSGQRPEKLHPMQLRACSESGLTSETSKLAEEAYL